jgi:phage terminase small subunit
MKKNTNKLSPKQNKFITLYTDSQNMTFGNSYQSALQAGYSDVTARNITHLNPKWLSESIGNIQAIKPEQITQVLTSVIYNDNEPTYIKLKALELMMKHHNMLKQQADATITTVSLNLDLTPTPR